MASDTTISEAPAVTGNPQLRLAGMGWSHFVNDGAANFLPGVLPAILIGLHLPVALAGTLMAALLVGQGLQPFVGLIGDRIGGRTLSLAGLVGSSIGAGLVGLVASPAALIAVLVLIGASNAMFHPQALAGVRRLAETRQGLAMSIFLVGGEIGRGVWPVLAGLCVSWGGLRWLAWLALPGLASVFVLARCAPALPARTADSAPIAWRKHIGGLSRLVVFCALRAFVIFAAVTVLPLMWSAGGGSLTAGASLITVLLVVGVIGNLSGGWLADRLGSRVLLIGSMLASALCALALAFVGGFWLWLCTAALGIALFATLPLTILIAQDLLPENRSFGSGLALGLANALGAVAVIGIGPVIGAAGASAGFSLAAGAALLAALLAVWVPERERGH
ncbi:MFS transporter [Salinisphaera hydrothermalis]|uniref:Major facilitator superfamily transporter n=1 Tax=Salinisphaera hydrothermalis (strain C41B8) TaxID=1304275 RepID=A0A084IGC8_SALHC|nr:MFS transporter [Salinisphaera hydrothermalis]KEZ75762.1 major facilitator superfamily transporter [Salinisphaera hydrothermalis C41B8]